MKGAQRGVVGGARAGAQLQVRRIRQPAAELADELEEPAQRHRGAPQKSEKRGAKEGQKIGERAAKERQKDEKKTGRQNREARAGGLLHPARKREPQHCSDPADELPQPSQARLNPMLALVLPFKRMVLWMHTDVHKDNGH